MSILPNGTVLPHGLLNPQGYDAKIAGFNRSFKNTGLKAGFVIKSYDINDPNNVYGLSTEYDVQTIEQNENKGSTSLLYRHCLSAQGFGSIADYLEFNLRPQTYQSVNAPAFNGQDGAIVLIRCLDDIGSKAIVVGSLIHPDRDTNIVNSDPHLVGQYNGVGIAINPDGSCSLTFKGATDSEGNPVNSSQGTTVFQIQPDGSYQFTNSAVTISGTKAGILNINTTSDINVQAQGNIIANCNNATVTATATATVEGQTVKLGKNAAQSVIRGDDFKQYLDGQFQVMTALGPSGFSINPVPPSNLSTKVKTE